MSHDPKEYLNKLHEYLDDHDRFEELINGEIDRRAALPEYRGRSFDSIADEITREIKDNMNEIVFGLSDEQVREALARAGAYDDDVYDDDSLVFGSFGELLDYVYEQRMGYSQEELAEEDRWLDEFSRHGDAEEEDVLVAYYLLKDKGEITSDAMDEMILSFYPDEDDDAE